MGGRTRLLRTLGLGLAIGGAPGLADGFVCVGTNASAQGNFRWVHSTESGVGPSATCRATSASLEAPIPACGFRRASKTDGNERKLMKKLAVWRITAGMENRLIPEAGGIPGTAFPGGAGRTAEGS